MYNRHERTQERIAEMRVTEEEWAAGWNTWYNRRAEGSQEVQSKARSIRDRIRTSSDDINKNYETIAEIAARMDGAERNLITLRVSTQRMADVVARGTPTSAAGGSPAPTVSP